MNGWTQSPTSHSERGPRPGPAVSGLSQPSSPFPAANDWNSSVDGHDPFGYPADLVSADRNFDFGSPNGFGGALLGGVQYNKALAKTNQAATSRALVTQTYPPPDTRQQMPFSGLYEDVEFPVRTLFTPPRPPGEVLPRVKRPARGNTTAFATNIAFAGMREHQAQREVSRVWRGVLCRRRLRQARETNALLNNEARRIQCWWRCLLARWRRRQLTAIRAGWAKERTGQFISQRVLNTTSILYWQHAKFESAAIRIQRAVRWFLREQARRRCAARGLPESEWPPAMVKPPATMHRPYFPWRVRRAAAATSQARAKAAAAEKLAMVVAELQPNEADSEHPSPHRTLLQFRERRASVEPPTQAEVEEINAKMREREAAQVVALHTPEAVSRAEWKTDGLRSEDLDFNAGVVQRLYRRKKAPEEIHTRELTAAYFNRAARIIARTFRMYVLIKRMRAREAAAAAQARARNRQVSERRIDDFKSDVVWQRELMDGAATSIQRCWAWYRYRHHGIVSAAHQAAHTVPTPPCYGLIQSHLKRQRALRWASMSLRERHEYEKNRSHKYYRYVPDRCVIFQQSGFLGSTRQDEL